MSINIPSQLQTSSFRFVKIQQEHKNPFEKEWQKTNNYTWNDPEIQQHINNHGNYGVVCGYGNLTVIDTDKTKVEDAVKNNLPKTFTVETGRGGKHFYYICQDINKPIRMIEEKMGDLGDVQYTGKQVVGPGSTHPNGKLYKVTNDIEIATVSVEQIQYALRNFIKTETQESAEDEKQLTKNTDINLSITDVVPLTGLKKRGNEYQGPHPLHGSNTGQNFCINTQKNVWHCFRDNTGGGPLSWLAVKYGIINCNEATPGALRGPVFKKVIKKAEKEGIIKKTIVEKEIGVYKKDGKIVPKILADEIMQEYSFITTRDNEDMYHYNDGIYHHNSETIIKEEINNRLGEETKEHWANEVIFQIKASTYINREEINNNPRLIHLQNGIFNIEAMQLQPFTPNIISTTSLPINYNPNADCPKIKQFLTEILAEDDIPIIQELLGYCLLKDYPIQKSFMFVGEGENGKSTLLSLFKAYLGIENIAGVSLQDLESRFAKSELYGKMANIHADLPETALYRTGIFKMLTGGDIISAEEKFKGRFNFINYAKLIFSANKLPEVKDETTAFFRRWIIINFPNTFEGKTADKKIIEKITTDEEISGLFNWAIQGMKRLLGQSYFSYLKTTEEIRDTYERMSNPLSGFIKDKIEIDPESYITKDDFYSEFVKYCKDNKFPVKPKNVVGREMQVHVPGIRTERPKLQGGRTQVWKGISLTNQNRIPDIPDRKLNLDILTIKPSKNQNDVKDVKDISLFKYINSNLNIKLIGGNPDISDIETIKPLKNQNRCLDIPDTKLRDGLNNKGVRKEKDNEIGKWMINHFKAHKGISRDFFVRDVQSNFPESLDPEEIRKFYDLLRQQDQEGLL